MSKMPSGRLSIKSVFCSIRNSFPRETHVERGRKNHVAYIIILLIFLCLPFFIHLKQEGSDRLAVGGFTIPPTCMSHALFHTNCPGCGLTRSFVYLTHGQIMNSFKAHHLGPLIYLFFLLLLAYRVYCLANPGKPLPEIIREMQFYGPLLIIFLLLFNWIFGLFTHS